MKENICNKRFLNYVASLYENPNGALGGVDINPYYMMKYDCRAINDILTTYVSSDQFYMIAACTDCYIRVFNIKEIDIVACLKGIFGAPLCLDVSSD